MGGEQKKIERFPCENVHYLLGFSSECFSPYSKLGILHVQSLLVMICFQIVLNLFCNHILVHGNLVHSHQINIQLNMQGE